MVEIFHQELDFDFHKVLGSVRNGNEFVSLSMSPKRMRYTAKLFANRLFCPQDLCHMDNSAQAKAIMEKVVLAALDEPALVVKTTVGELGIWDMSDYLCDHEIEYLKDIDDRYRYELGDGSGNYKWTEEDKV